MRPMHGNGIIHAVAHDPRSDEVLLRGRNKKDTTKTARGGGEAEPVELAAGSWAAVLAPRLAQFTAVARHEHVTRAALELGIPQPTLSRALVRLEDDLGVALFARHGRTLSLTPAGRAFLASTERALTDLERATESVRADVDPAAGKVAFGFLHTLGSETVPGLIRSFRTDHPRVRFQLVQTYGEAMIERLRAGDLDLCLTSPVPDYPDLIARRLDEQKLRLVVPDDHPLAARKRIRLAEAAGELFVCLEPGFGLRRITDALCAEAGFTPASPSRGRRPRRCADWSRPGWGWRCCRRPPCRGPGWPS